MTTIAAYTGADGSAEWAQGVLNNYVTASATLNVPSAGKHTLRVYGIDPGVVLREIRLDQPLRVRPIAASAALRRSPWALRSRLA